MSALTKDPINVSWSTVTLDVGRASAWMLRVLFQGKNGYRTISRANCQVWGKMAVFGKASRFFAPTGRFFKKFLKIFIFLLTPIGALLYNNTNGRGSEKGRIDYSTS